MRPKSGRPRQDPRIRYWLFKVEGLPATCYIRFLENQEYSITKDREIAHVVKGSPEFARGFCLAMMLYTGKTITPIERPHIISYNKIPVK